jgi:hypothetical protein
LERLRQRLFAGNLTAERGDLAHHLAVCRAATRQKCSYDGHDQQHTAQTKLPPVHSWWSFAHGRKLSAECLRHNRIRLDLDQNLVVD